MAALGVALAAVFSVGSTSYAHPPSSDYAAKPAVSPPPGDTTYVFGWGDLPTDLALPRGGSSMGAPVTLAPGVALPLPAMVSARDAVARDRVAILALAGDYRVSVHESEQVGLAADYRPIRSYHSWATEAVRLVEDAGKRISLQHTLVMYFKNGAGAVSGPVLTKHWRQDWTYEKTELHRWSGNDIWIRRQVPTNEASGTWTHSVYNLEDSPRYETIGRWEHRGNVSAWTSERAWRPLPRREHSVRQDYDVLEGTHQVTLTPTGWVEERKMWKRATDGLTAVEPPRYLAEEIGIDRYERITAPSLAAADAYWKTAAPYWAIVRRVWAEETAGHERFTLRDEVDGKISYTYHNDYLKKIAAGQPFDAIAVETFVRTTIRNFIAPAPEPKR